MIPSTIIGIDPGSSNGGIAIWKKGELTKTIRMPKNEELNRLSVYFDHINESNNDVVVFIEKIAMFLGDKDVGNVAKQYRLQQLKANYERIIAFLVHKKLPYVPTHPMSWQSTLKLRRKWENDSEKKKAFKTYAQNCFPELIVTLLSSDALCLIQFAFRKYEDDLKWIQKNIKNEQNNSLF